MRALVTACLTAITMLAATTAAAGPAPTKEAALAALDAWSKAQNAGDLAAYTALYDAGFVGIKRTNDGRETRYTLAKWKADRAKMFKAPQKVAALGPKVAIAGDKVTIAFVQRWEGKGYADHGNKVLMLRPGKDGALEIVREEMLYSAPGWKEDPKAEVDATALVSPIKATLRQVASADVGDCGGVTFFVDLVDARGKKLTTDIGGGTINIERKIDVVPADTTSDTLFAVGEWCAGGADYYEVKRAGDALVVRYKGEDEGSEDDPAPPAVWETRMTITLPPKAMIH